MKILKEKNQILNPIKNIIYSNGVKVILTSLIAALACTGIIYAATTVGTNITTTGTLDVTGASTFTTASSTGIVKFAEINSDTGAISFGDENLTTTGALNVTGLTTLGNASTTLLSVSGNTYITGILSVTGNSIFTTASSTGIVKFSEINSDTGTISFGDENLITTGDLDVSGDLTVAGSSPNDFCTVTICDATTNANTLTGCNYVTDGTLSTGGDEVQVQAAADALAAGVEGGGNICLIGKFYFTDPVVLNETHSGLHFIGSTGQGGADGIKGSYLQIANSGLTKSTGRTVDTTVTASNSGGCLWTSDAHKLHLDDRVRFTTTGDLPCLLEPATDYFVSTIPTATTFTISATPAGEIIAYEATESGTHGLVDETNYGLFELDTTGGGGDIGFVSFSNFIMAGNKANNTSGTAIIGNKDGGSNEPRDIHITGIYFNDFAGTCIDSDEAWGWVIDKNVIERCNIGIRFTGGSAARIINNKIKENVRHGIYLDTAPETGIHNNQIGSGTGVSLGAFTLTTAAGDDCQLDFTAAHNLAVDDMIYVSSSINDADLPCGLASDTNYFIATITDSDSVELSSRVNGSVINVSADTGGAGTWTGKDMTSYAIRIVSIHAPARGATPYRLLIIMEQTLFQSTPPHGGRQWSLYLMFGARQRFNPRPRTGGDSSGT